MEQRAVDDDRASVRSVVYFVSDPLVRARHWIFIVGLASILGALIGLGAAVFLFMGRNGPLHGGAGAVYMAFQLGSSAFACWMGLLLCQAARHLGRTQVSVDPGDFERSQRKLRTYFIVQGVLVTLGLVVSGIMFAFVGLGALLDL